MRAAAGIETPIVQSSGGAISGLKRDGSLAFLGIPFAQAPVGPRRFATPRAPLPWTGTFEAHRLGATPQRNALAEITLIPEPSIPGESTLNLNVYTPGTDTSLPVLVWIHGGGFVAGSSASPWYDGARFAADGCVTVVVSYRLGFDGFGIIEDAPSNRGARDWILALEWVRDNIAAFGGDPSRVTIAGQSAGGGAVLTLMATPAARGLFQRAISLSGAVADIPLDVASERTRLMAERAGVPPTAAGFGSLDEATILRFQNDVAPLDDPDDPLAMASAGLPWGPVVDGELLPGPTLEQLDPEIPLLLGTTDAEFRMAADAWRESLQDVSPAQALARAGVPQHVARRYAAHRPELDAANTVGQYLTDRLFRAPAREIAERRLTASAPTWLYRFAWSSPTIAMACHCVDVPFFWDADAVAGEETTRHLLGGPAPRGLTEEFHGSVVDFIVGDDLGWSPYAAGREVRVFDTTTTTVRDGYSDVRDLEA